ncbi:MAG: sn-glycerol-3-phosphate ABC transporter ATP-binding protein UgpC [Bacteroidota bacterium]|jgi:multiple sugar transport system ATP-binding protein|nr:sn-glycerol-3-phosphate ABC transporter ATP-binding protein UgpC [Bacteroidota bacterium]
MADVRFDGVAKSYGNGPPIIRQLDLHIRDGEFMVLVGPSGCGKSTTLRMVAGLEDVSAGRLFIGDRLVNDVAPKDRDIAMVFQNYALYPHMNVRENMAFGLTLRKFDRAEIDRRVQEAAGLLEIRDLLDRKPRELSGGQRQRVALGRAIVRKPAVFLFDEPLSNLDAQLRVQMRAEIRKLHRRLGTTMIYVTHDQVEAMTMGDRITVMKDGEIHQVDAPTALYSHPADRFVAGFIGSPSMNFISAAVLDHGSTLLVDDETAIAVPVEQQPLLDELHGGRVTLGLRPEHIHLTPQGCAYPARVMVVHVMSELLGSEISMHLTLHGQPLTGRAPVMTRVEMGARLEVFLDIAHARYFAADDGRALSSRDR